MTDAPGSINALEERIRILESGLKERDRVIDKQTRTIANQSAAISEAIDEQTLSEMEAENAVLQERMDEAEERNRQLNTDLAALQKRHEHANRDIVSLIRTVAILSRSI